jgi:hypothetical protein
VWFYSWLPKFRDSLYVPSSKVQQSKGKDILNCLILEDEADRFFRNVVNQLPTYVRRSISQKSKIMKKILFYNSVNLHETPSVPII